MGTKKKKVWQLQSQANSLTHHQCTLFTFRVSWDYYCNYHDPSNWPQLRI